MLKSVRNDVNRRVNAEIANQAKTAEASVEQIQAIRTVLEHQDIKTLPHALQDLHSPARHVSQRQRSRNWGSGQRRRFPSRPIYHRVRRIEQMASDIAKS